MNLSSVAEFSGPLLWYLENKKIYFSGCQWDKLSNAPITRPSLLVYQQALLMHPLAGTASSVALGYQTIKEGLKWSEATKGNKKRTCLWKKEILQLLLVFIWSRMGETAAVQATKATNCIRPAASRHAAIKASASTLWLTRTATTPPTTCGTLTETRTASWKKSYSQDVWRFSFGIASAANAFKRQNQSWIRWLSLLSIVKYYLQQQTLFVISAVYFLKRKWNLTI